MTPIDQAKAILTGAARDGDRKAVAEAFLSSLEMTHDLIRSSGWISRAYEAMTETLTRAQAEGTRWRDEALELRAEVERLRAELVGPRWQADSGDTNADTLAGVGAPSEDGAATPHAVVASTASGAAQGPRPFGDAGCGFWAETVAGVEIVRERSPLPGWAIVVDGEPEELSAFFTHYGTAQAFLAARDEDGEHPCYGNCDAVALPALLLTSRERGTGLFWANAFDDKACAALRERFGYAPGDHVGVDVPALESDAEDQ